MATVSVMPARVAGWQQDTSCLYDVGCTVGGVPDSLPLNDLTLGGAAGVQLQQTVTGLTIGNTYVLEFWSGGENSYSHRGLFAADVGFGDTLFRNKTTSPLWSGDIGTRYIIEFNATSSSHTIKFTNWGHICLSCTELIIDDVRLYTLAELSPVVPHCTTGINKFNEMTAINLFPNPITNTLNISNNNNELSVITMYDITLRKLLEQQFSNSITINTQQFAKGIYVYEVRDKNGVIKKGRVVKD